MVRFLHIADLHLGMRITRFSQEAIAKVRQARFHALENVRERARQPGADFDFVVIAGDLFDDPRVAGEITRRAYELLQSFPVPVLVLPGNHDPLQPGSVWDANPWNSATSSDSQVRVLRERSPFVFAPGVTIYPCPVFRKTSTENPTDWIKGHPQTAEDGIRIGIAHGSVMDRPNLPLDDHPIGPTATDDLRLDYLALGHWHNPKDFPDAAGIVRTVYPGVHEPMRFRGDTEATGWVPYSSGAARDEFLDQGSGSAIAVTIDAPGAAPQIETLSVGYHRWTLRDERVDTPAALDALINEVSAAPDKATTLLRLRLTGTLPLESLTRVESDLRSILASYVVGELDARDLVVEPDEAEVRAVVGEGVLAQVFRKLQERTVEGHPEAAVSRSALRVLYRLARSVS